MTQASLWYENKQMTNPESIGTHKNDDRSQIFPVKQVERSEIEKCQLETDLITARSFLTTTMIKNT